MNEYPSNASYSGFPVTPTPRPRVNWQLNKSKPVVTYAIMAVTVFVFVLQFLSQSLLGVDLPAQYGMKVNELIRAGQFWRFFTPMLLHASLIHIGFNLYALFILGPGLEQQFGRVRFFLLYLCAGFAGNVASFIFSPDNSLGASTAIFGLVAAEGVFILKNRKMFGRNAGRMLGNIGIVILINLMLGLQPGIDNWGHLGGLVGGVIYAFVAGPVWKAEPAFGVIDIVDQTETARGWMAAAAVIILFSVFAFLQF